MQVEVEILVQTITAQYGVLSQGDILRTSAEFAKHLVEDCGAAKYKKAMPAAIKPADAPAAITADHAAPLVDVQQVASPTPAKAGKPKS